MNILKIEVKINKTSKRITENYFENYKYQRDAIAKGLDILDKHNGVLDCRCSWFRKKYYSICNSNKFELKSKCNLPTSLKRTMGRLFIKFKISGKVYSQVKFRSFRR